MSQNIKHMDALVREMRGGSYFRSSLLLITIIICLLITFIWMQRAELDQVTRGAGKVVPSGEIQIIQTAESGVLTKIHVKEGEIVAKGDPLVTIDGTQFEGQLEETRRKVASLRLRIARLSAENRGVDFKPDASFQDIVPDLVIAEQALILARKQAMNDEVVVLNDQVRQQIENIQESKIRLTTIRNKLELLNEEIAVIAPLVREGIESQTSLLRLKSSLAGSEGAEILEKATLSRKKAALQEVENKIEAVASRFQAKVLEEMASTQADLAGLSSRLPALEMRLTRAVLTAPMRGIVNRIHLSTQGAVARPGDPLVELVPLGDDIKIEAYLKPTDIAFIHSGQKAKIAISAYDASRYGYIDGIISRVGANAITHSETKEQVFIVEVTTNGHLTDAEDKAVDIFSGMTAQVDILTGRRTVWEYLTAPVVRVKERALRD